MVIALPVNQPIFTIFVVLPRACSTNWGVHQPIILMRSFINQRQVSAVSGQTTGVQQCPDCARPAIAPDRQHLLGNRAGGLCATLDVAQPGDTIFMTTYGSSAGSDAYSIVVTPTLLERRNRAPLMSSYLARQEFVDYAVYVKWRNELVLG